MKDGPVGHGFGCDDRSRIDWHQRHVVREFSALCLMTVCLRGVRSCGSRHGLDSRLVLLGLFVFSFLLLGFV